MSSSNARVVSIARDVYVVSTESGEIEAGLSGRFRYESSETPAVGDWVALRAGTPLIDAILPRKSVLARRQPGRGTEAQVLAANVDRLFVVNGLDGDFNLRRIERYLLFASESGAEPVLVLNKADLHPDPSDAAEQVRAIAGGAEVLVTSALTGDGIALIRAAPGETAALIGSSGAGKSTILNRICGREVQRTHEVRHADSRGRHTTTRRELFAMPGGWFLIDLPGLREIQLWNSDLDSAFTDIAELAARCRFRDCRHQGEPGCAVAQAVLDEDLDEARLGNYARMQRELAHLDRQQNQRAALELKREWKRIHRAMRRDKRD